MHDEHFHRPAPPPRHRRPGEEVWRLHGRDGRVQTCELRDDSKAGAGWDVMLLESGEPLLSRRCGSEQIARYVAEAAKKDLLRTGWAEEQPGRASLSQ
jgi:hypothetical protein